MSQELGRYPNAEVTWVQEEPKNMGAWNYVQPRLAMASGQARKIRYSNEVIYTVETMNKGHLRPVISSGV